MITLKQHSKMRGMFMIERQKHHPDGSPIPGTREVVAPWQDNLLLDSGLDNLGGSNWMRRCEIGAGSATPSPSNIGLASPLGSQDSNTVTNGPSTGDYVSVVNSWLFPPGSATGIIAELGVGPTSGSLTTRALVRDENGDPTTIVKGPIDSLTVTYQIREYPDKTDSTYQVTNPHTSQVYDVVSRTIGGTASDRLRAWHFYGPVADSNLGGQPAGRMGVGSEPLVPWDSTSYTSGNTASDTVLPYSPGNHYRDLRSVWIEGAGNIPGGITRVRKSSNSITNPFYIQASFDPPIDKDNTKTLAITLRKSWGRYVP